MAIQTSIARYSSSLLRILSYIFLRWAPIPVLPNIVFGLFAVYVPSFVSSYRAESGYEVVDDEIDVVVKDTVVDGNGGAPAANGDGVVLVEEEIDVQETVVLKERPPGVLRTLLSGAPSPRSLVLSALTFLLNLACVAMVADRLYGEQRETGEDLSFVRVGYVSHAEAKLLIREKDQSKMPITVRIRVRDPQRPLDNPPWQTAGGVRWTLNETDFTAALTIPLRHASQRTYEWVSSNNHSGEFTSPPKPGQVPGLRDRKFTFLTTSCIVSRLPYSPFDHPLAIPGMRHLAALLPRLDAQFMLFLGDFIYADVPRWLGQGVEDYRRKYRQVYASPDWSAVGQNLSWIHVLDDHDIANDWSSNDTGVYKAALEPWRHYHAVVNPPPARRAAGAGAAGEEGATYFAFAQGPASFFMLDTRSYRSSNDLPANSTEKTMLGAEQLDDLLDYLRRPEPKGVKWKIVASSVPFTKNWPVNRKDTWGGFLVERKTVLEAMWDVSARGIGVVILSGDRHEFAATKFPPPEGSRWPASATVHEYSASPLSQFYSPYGTYKQTDDEDVKIKYINRGNSKFGAVTIESLEDGDQSSLTYRLFVDGKEAWNSVILSPPATAEGKKAGGGFWNRLNNV